MNNNRKYLFVCMLSFAFISGIGQVKDSSTIIKGKPDSNNEVHLLRNLSKQSFSANKFKEAREYLSSTIVLARESGNINEIRDCYEQLSAVHVKLNDFKNARLAFITFIQFRDSILAEENTRKMVQAQMQRGFDKKMEADKILQDKINLQHAAITRQQNIILFVVIAGLLLVSVFSFSLFNRFRLITRQKKIIEVQKDEVEVQRKLADERRKIAEEQSSVIEEKQKEILDSIRYARRIQRALIPSDKYIEKCLNNLKKDG